MHALSEAAEKLFQGGAGPAFVRVDDSGVPVPPPAAGIQPARLQHAQAVADADLPAELRRRYLESEPAR
jgi:hypothetical protein